MSNRSRLGLVAAAALIAVVAFLVLEPEDESEKADEPVTNTSAQTTTAPPPPPPPPEIVLRGGSPRGGVARIEASKGDLVRFVVRSDESDEIHLHGYDIERTPGPGRPARFRFRADVEGTFEIESHTAEDAGREPLVARLVVEP